ncbi:hypothetical protein C1H46_004211 [Malus baccata]|uniref:DUF4005 domain-containing protein n=1 Tax=Malus baccata TaxID=106549 RepID=A0A540NGI9_MALBA|nr:hypothetical protein C1H46_004211 [Malus baccata]
MGSEKKNTNEKYKGLGKLKQRETNSFIPLFREPSSIEKNFGDFEREQQRETFRPPTPDEQPRTPPFVPPRVSSPRLASPRAPSPRAPSPRAPSPRVPPPRAPPPRDPSPSIIHQHKEISYRREPTIRNHHASATKIQAAYRGYTARRSFRALKGLVRLQGVVSGQNVKRQTMNAMKYMQLLVRVQSQIQSRRIQMLENQARHQVQYKNDREMESTFTKWNLSQQSEMANNEEWDDSLLTKEEVEARLQKKVEAVMKRERAIRILQPARTPPLINTSRTPQANRFGISKYARTPVGGAESPFGFPLKDDDSLTSCPPFSVPNYMAPTASAKAKARASSNPRERSVGTPSSETKRRLSFPLAQGIGSFKWNKAYFFSNNKDSSSERNLDKNQSLQSLGNSSIDSTVSMPAGVGRKPFNRFV